MKWNHKLLYLLTLGALCLYVTTGPAEALVPVSGPTITNTWASLDTTQGVLNALTYPYFTPDWGKTVALELDVTCMSGPCQGTVDFGLFVDGPGLISFELGGTSDDSTAWGDVLFPVYAAVDPSWTVNNDGHLSMTSFSVSVPGADWYHGQFTINSLAGGSSIHMSPGSLDITTYSDVPEPSSALLLGAGFAFVEFLRRKSRR